RVGDNFLKQPLLPDSEARELVVNNGIDGDRSLRQPVAELLLPRGERAKAFGAQLDETRVAHALYQRGRFFCFRNRSRRSLWRGLGACAGRRDSQTKKQDALFHVASDRANLIFYAFLLWPAQAQRGSRSKRNQLTAIEIARPERGPEQRQKDYSSGSLPSMTRPPNSSAISLRRW